MRTYKLEIIEKKPNVLTSKPPLIFVHGASGGAWYFINYLNYFSNLGYTCYAFSLRGHGLSEGNEDIHQFRLDDYVDDLSYMVDLVGSKPIIMGHSMGGAITQRFLGLYQDKVHAAILLASAKVNGIEDESPLGLFFSDARHFLRTMRKKAGYEKIKINDLLNETIFSNRFDPITLSEIKKKLTIESNLVKKDLLKPFIKSDIDINIPVYVIGSKGDHIISERDLFETANFFETEVHYIVNPCHFLTIDPDWIEGAEEILTILGKI
jgi:pimeloyl-ACP methyl ester carboxylesterase